MSIIMSILPWKFLIQRRLNATLKPNPGLRARRLAQMSPERRARYQKTIDDLGFEE